MAHKVTAQGLIQTLIVLCLLFSPPQKALSDAVQNGISSDRIISPQDSSAAKQGLNSSEELCLTIDQAILMAFENNPALKIERYNPQITGTYVEEICGEYDPVVTGAFDYTQDKSPLSPAAAPYLPDTTSGSAGLGVGLSQHLPTGTDISATLDSLRLWSDRYSDRYRTRAGLNVTQALLRGRPLDVNFASLRQAEMQTRISFYELRGFTEALLAAVETKYWQYTVARLQVDIFQESMALAKIQMDQTREMIRVGQLAETELIASRAEMALRRQELIEAQSAMEIARLQLLRYLNPPGPGFWHRPVNLMTEPIVPGIEIADVEEHVAVALAKRADLNEARLLCEKGEIEVIKTKDGLLPRMDFFIYLGKTGYADTFGESIVNLFDDGYDITAGLRFTHSLKNRSAKATHKRSRMAQQQSQTALANLIRLAELDIHSAHINIGRFRRQIDASKATRQLQEEKLRIETEKFHVGRSTNYMVAQAQRDLVRSRISETEAVADYLIALTELHRLEGSLLERRGIEPVQ